MFHGGQLNDLIFVALGVLGLLIIILMLVDLI